MKKIITLLATVACFGLPDATAQITYADIVPDTTVSSWDAYSFSLNGAATGSITLWFHPWSPNEVVVSCYGDYQVLMDGSGMYPAKLSMDDNIGSTGNWKTTSYDILNKGGSIGNWVSAGTDKFLGIRFKKSGHWYYGWMKMSVDNTPTMFTVKEKAYNTKDDESIKAGQMVATHIGNVTTEEAFNISMKDKQVSIKCPYVYPGYHVIVNDISGRVIKTLHNTNDPQIDFSMYPGGIYYIRLGTEHSWNTFKISLP